VFDVVKKKREFIVSYIEGEGWMTSWDLTFKGFLSANMKRVDNKF
jgi:hypothetical protein